MRCIKLNEYALLLQYFNLIYFNSIVKGVAAKLSFTSPLMFLYQIAERRMTYKLNHCPFGVDIKSKIGVECGWKIFCIEDCQIP